MRRKTATFAALVLSTALTSTATPAAELSQAVDTTQEIPMEAEEPVLTDSTELSTESEDETSPAESETESETFSVTEAETQASLSETEAETQASDIYVDTEPVSIDASTESLSPETTGQEDLLEEYFEYDAAGTPTDAPEVNYSSLAGDYMDGSAGGDATAYSAAPLYLAASALSLDTDDMQIVTAYDLTKQMLSRVGCGYSQLHRYDVDYYDCSSLIARSMYDLGITSNVPITTADWNQKCQNMAVGDIMTFVGSGRKISYQLAAKNVTHRQNPEYFEIPGTIAVYIAPNAYSGHVSVVVGSYDRQDNGHDPVTEQSAILKDTTDYVASQIEKTYGIPASKMTGISSITGHTSIWLHSETMGTDMKKIDGTPSGTYNPVWRIEAYSDDYGVCVTNAITGTAGNQVARYVFVPYVEKTTPAPTITSAKVSNVSSDGYTVTVTFDAQEGVSSLQLPTWTEKNGQDDLVWHNASVSGNTATFHVKASDHKGETGSYITHIYLTDKKGRRAPIYGLTATLPAPVKDSLPIIKTAVASNITSSGYDVTATFDAPAGVVSVLMPTWTENGGQDDLVWHNASVSGNTATFHVKASDHKGETGSYITHIYLTDKKGRRAPIYGLTATLPAPVKDSLPIIKTAVASNITSSGYDVTATFDAPAGVVSVLMPTWTENGGQDDLVWHNASVSGNTATFHVNVSQHGWESGKYITHIYVKSKNGESKPVPVYVTVPAASSKKYIHNGVDYSAVFDPVYYLGHYQDLRNAFGNNYDLAFKHFISNGMKEARIAKESFNVVNYRNRYVDLRNAFGSNWAAYYTHYISYGIKENRNSN